MKMILNFFFNTHTGSVCLLSIDTPELKKYSQMAGKSEEFNINTGKKLSLKKNKKEFNLTLLFFEVSKPLYVLVACRTR